MNGSGEHDRVLLVGGGGHAVVIAEAAVLMGLHLAGFLDDRQDAPLAVGIPSAQRLGSLNQVQLAAEHPYILAVGDLAIRLRVLGVLEQIRAVAARVIHPSAIVSDCAVVEEGVFVAAGAVVQPRARVGEHAIVNTGAIVEHDCDVATNSHIAPGVVLGGRCRIGPNTLVGLGSRVLPGVSVGAGSVVGAGAVVTEDVADGVTVVGVPARPLATDEL